MKCKTEHSFRRFEFGLFPQFVVVFVISLLLLVWLGDRPLPEQPQDPLPAELPTGNA